MEHDRYGFYVGVDLGREKHFVVVIDGDGTPVAERKLRHDGADLANLVRWLEATAGGAPDRVAVAIEVTRGAAVETLLASGFHVYGLNPKQLDRFRDRHTIAGAKDDRLDSLVLADSLRTDRKAFRRLENDDPVIVELRGAVRLDRELRDDVVRLTNQLSQKMNEYFPQFLQFGSLAKQTWVWALIELVPTPRHAQEVRPRNVQKLLDQYRIRRLEARRVCQILRQPPLVLAPGAVEAAAFHVLALVPRLRLAHQQRAQCEARLGELLAELAKPATTEGLEGERREHRDVEILLSCPGLGTRVAATMLAEAHRPLEQRAYHHLRSYAGAAPVTRRSGKHTTVSMRRACSHILRDAVFHWTSGAIQKDERSRAIYDDARARGLTRSRALRSVSDSLLRMVCAMLRNGNVYDPNRRSPQPVTGT